MGGFFIFTLHFFILILVKFLLNNPEKIKS